MPRKQRFKPSRKAKPEVVEGIPFNQGSHLSAEDFESAQTVRTQHADFGPIEVEERPK